MKRRADLVLCNGSIYAPPPNYGTAEAVAIAGGRIVYVGTVAAAGSWSGPETTIIDLEGRALLPGFHDCHIHAVGGALYGTFQIPLAGIATSEAILQCVRAYIAENPRNLDYMGIGWGYSAFPAEGPAREDLDAISPWKPVFLMSCDGHSAWVNSPALALAGITRETTDPPGGCIMRHPLTGEPTGWLKEPVAYRQVLQHFSLPDTEQLKASLLEFFRRLSAEGITSIFQPGIELLGREDTLEILHALDAEEKMPVRVSAGITCSARDGLNPGPAVDELRREFSGRRFKVEAAKLFLDGVLETRTARLIAPYSGSMDFKGEDSWAEEDLKRVLVSLDREGIQAHIHAIGDGAVRLALDGIESAAKVNGPKALRHTIAHMDLTDRVDIQRFQRLGAIACLQPTWFHLGEEQRRAMKLCLGEERAMRLYSMRTLIESGALVTCGSDYPAEASGFLSFRPLDGIEMGHTRSALGDAQNDCYLPEERVSLADMIDCYTIRAAFQLHHEKETGSIEPGKLADLIVLDRDPFSVPPYEIHEARVVLTLLEGRIVFRDPSF
jgi:predicted amidohydrolase YtcJ